ncbi:translation initiation factor IF3-1, mitochondrial isoform X2 [Solanum dulcamara]|uniref:translation initiation factor IF3-1, mitochondrial isoform X2 n=1 Tax=Solanum dulcamara TaxID=45834 RepID=UPI002486B2DC|nr:translation initiation factor IF3-1, mitochondrial isoform X2 [Solanum dulcamara]
MAFWCRVKNSKIKTLSIHLKRCYFQYPHGSNSLIASASQPLVRVLSNSSLTIPKSPFEFSKSVRCFAAPVQAKTRKEEKDTSGPRLNREITADVVRLVVDEGHRIVSIREALELARSLNLDLVEVARSSKPPVCRIMDYHKEKYQKQLKESAKKSKSELTLKKGDCKEVRFVGKIEKKDLQIKADTVKRMMERGYRVKCTAMSMGDGGEDLGAVLSRFSPLIEDVAYVESGPRVEKKQAYIVVRHVKFGPSKKGSGKKASKEYKTAISAEDCNESASVAPESFLQSKQNCDTSESSIESDDDSCVEAMTDEDIDNARADFASVRRAHDSSRTETTVPLSGGQRSFRRESGNTLQGPSGEENRYRRDPSSRSTKLADTISDIGRQVPLDRSTLSHTRDLGSQFPRKSPEQHSSQSSGRSSPSSGFGIFSSPQADRTPGNENNVATQNRYKKSEQFNSGRNSSASDPRGLPMGNAQARRPDLGRRDGQGKYPVFGDSANMKPDHSSETQR